MSTTRTVSARRTPSMAIVFVAVAVAAAALAGCTSDPEAAAPTPGEAVASCAPDQMPEPIPATTSTTADDAAATTVRLLVTDSFAVSDATFAGFTKETGITVEVVPSDDAGTMVSQAILTAGEPVADVLYGIDTTFLCRGTRAGLFVPYESPALTEVPAEYQLDPDHLATPVDVGDVCLNYRKDAFGDDPPTTLDDLKDPAYRDAFVTEDPETSSPGLAFLLATVAAYGPDRWEDYWKDLRANGVKVDPGWTEAYEGSFGSGADGADRSIVTSYATSPVADVVYADPPRDDPAIGVVADSCFRQVEFAGILRGTEHPDAAARLIDFLLSPTFQDDIPLNMFVEPVSDRATLPAVFEANRTPIDHPLTLTPAEIEAGRDRWTERWTEIVVR